VLTLRAWTRGDRDGGELAPTNDCGRGRGWEEGQNGERSEGDRFLSSPWVGIDAESGIDSGGRRGVGLGEKRSDTTLWRLGETAAAGRQWALVGRGRSDGG
jgi:hypothetical protein